MAEIAKTYNKNSELRITNSELFSEAKKVIPGGVNSPVRSFKAVDGVPVFIDRASGSKLFAADKREFIDYCLSWGALILGHAYPEIVERVKKAIDKGTSFGTVTKLETYFAELIIEAVPSIEQVRLVNSGTEAVMSAIRLARAFTNKERIIKFEGAYHGHADYLLAKAGSGIATLGIPDSLGVPQDFTKHTILVPFNDLDAVRDMTVKHKNDLAAIIVEPVMANCGTILPEDTFLEGLRKICDEFNIVLIFDEVITGFRLAYGGAQEFFGINPDLTCLGKILGGGMPIGAFGGRKEIMQLLAPVGGVYQAGTLSGNPIAVTAGISQLEALRGLDPYAALSRETCILCEGIISRAKTYNIKLKCNHIGSIFSLFFTDEDVTNYSKASRQDLNLFKKFFKGLLAEGIYFSPSGFETNFLSTMHTDGDIERTLKAVEKVFRTMN